MIKKFLKVAGMIVLLLTVCVFVTVVLLQNKTFDAPYPKIKARQDSVTIATGRNLVLGAAHCTGCHGSANEPDTITDKEEPALSGGRMFDLPIGLLFAPNLTPHATGIADKTDEALARALRYGVATSGRALFDLMPFHNTSDEDLVAIISYLRSRPPVDNKVPENKMNMLGKVVKAFLLKPAGPSAPVPLKVVKDTGVVYGAYLANSVANCRGCHTNRNLMTGAFTGPDFAGGLKFDLPTDSGMYSLTTPNLTPDATGRITSWSQQQFINRFRQGTLIQESHMPWESFRHMSDDELTSIYNFLQTVKPVHNKVVAGLVKEK